jgi:hypothetical protein
MPRTAELRRLGANGDDTSLHIYLISSAYSSGGVTGFWKDMVVHKLKRRHVDTRRSAYIISRTSAKATSTARTEAMKQ